MADSETTPTESSPAQADETSDKSKVEYSKILDEVLDDRSATPEPSFKHPIILDFILAIGLLLTVGGFMLGIMNIWIAHQAKQSIMQKNYKAAIVILKALPFKGFFTIPGSDPTELLSQAMYQDAMEKLDANDQDQDAVAELSRIPAGSAFFDNAQEIVEEHSPPSQIQLQGKTEHIATPEEAVPPKKPLLPPAETDASP